jgi:nucleoside phosphorylase/CheY-like chemotaxis protein
MLKILILDDSPTKVQHIKEVLSSHIEICHDDWKVCDNARDAKQALRVVEYDLLILDIQIPNRQGEAPQRLGGVDLLREIHSRSCYKKPICIVGLTEYSEALGEIEEIFKDRLWSLVHYNQATAKWSDRLGSKIEYLLEMRKDEDRNLQYGVGLGIITALGVPEFDALFSINKWTPEEITRDPAHYWRTNLTSSEKHIEVVATHASQMGMPATAVAAMKMINQFRPKYLAMLGISAGFPEKVRIGDLVVADPCWDWGSGKRESTAHGTRFEPDPMPERLHPRIRTLFADIQRDSGLLLSAWDEYTESKPEYPPKLHVGPCVSGSCVLADEQTRDGIQEHSRKLVGIDMEAYGLMYAATNAPDPAPKAFSMKAVCDFADSKKNDGFQKYGSRLSAAVMQKIALKYF